MRLAAFIAVAAMCVSAGACDSATGPEAGQFPSLPGVGDALIPDSLRPAYRDDAVRLALRFLEATHSPGRNGVEPPAALVRTLRDALNHVYLFEHAARDTVIEVLRIHTFPNPQLHELIVGVDTTHAWVGEWRAGHRFTGQPGVDALLAQYQLSLREYYPWSFGHAVVLRSAEPLNMAALARRFVGIAGIRYAEPNGYMGDGNDIRARVQGSGWRLDYSLGAGDCPAGCTLRTTWSFLVDHAGTVSYLGRSGS
jgi:hypothetical protein